MCEPRAGRLTPLAGQEQPNLLGVFRPTGHGRVFATGHLVAAFSAESNLLDATPWICPAHHPLRLKPDAFSHKQRADSAGQLFDFTHVYKTLFANV